MYCPYCQVHYSLEEPCFCQQRFRSSVEVPERPKESGLLKAALFTLSRNHPRPLGRRGERNG